MRANSIQDWLDSYCGDRDGVVGGLVMLPAKPAAAPDVAAVWPAGGTGSEALVAAAKAALGTCSPVVKTAHAAAPPNAPTGQVISLPVRSGKRAIGAIAVELAENKPENIRKLLDEIIRAAAGLGDAYDTRKAEEPAAGQDAGSVLRIQSAVLSHDRFSTATAALATEAATALHCDGACVGLLENGAVEVVALSHRGEAGEQAAFLRAMADAMQEAIEQAATIVFPAAPGGAPRITLAHAELARLRGGSFCTIPLAAAGKVFGAITLERVAGEALAATEIAAGEHIACLVAPVIRLHRSNERPWHRRFLQAAGEAWRYLAGPGRWFAKAAVTTALVLAAGVLFIPVDYWVGATARIEGSVQRVLAAPVDGFISKVAVRPGDRVAAGQVLVELAEGDLQLERRKWMSELAQHENAQHAALARAERAQYVMSEAKAEGARAQLALIDEQLTRARITAPIDGVVIKGDLTQSMGAPVQRGEPLLTVAPANAFRLIVEVDERDIPDVKAGAAGALALAALPQNARTFRVERVTPVAVARDGRNFFEVEGTLGALPASVQPGLQGVAKIRSEPRSLAWIWTHRITDWLRLKLWSYSL